MAQPAVNFLQSPLTNLRFCQKLRFVHGKLLVVLSIAAVWVGLILRELIVPKCQLKRGADIGAENIYDTLALRVLFFRLQRLVSKVFIRQRHEGVHPAQPCV